MGKFDLSQYEEVKDRLPKFFDKYPDGRVLTELHDKTEQFETVIFKAYLYANKEDQLNNCPLSTGFAFEKDGDGYINKTSHIENCETSAIGRALANLTFHGSKRPSKEEMNKVEKMSKGLKDKKEEELF